MALRGHSGEGLTLHGLILCYLCILTLRGLKPPPPLRGHALVDLYCVHSNCKVYYLLYTELFHFFPSSSPSFRPKSQPWQPYAAMAAIFGRKEAFLVKIIAFLVN